MDKRVITVLGATGSVGVSALDVIARHADRYRVFALTAHTNVELLAEQCARFKPACAVVADAAHLDAAKECLRGLPTQALAGAAALEQVAADERCDTVIAGITGAVGLAPTLAAVRAGKRVLLANKEALVMAGALFMRAVKDSGAVLLPVDSEHNGVFQCLAQAPAAAVEKIILTASGGPFLDTPASALATVTPAQACAHPNWDMGAKISVDSATMMNKGLEVIEACWLFDLSPEQIEVLVHPQSVLHAMVVLKDGSVLAQLAQPDMRVPIACALAWPERIASGVSALDFTRGVQLQLQAVDEGKFPCLALAWRALRAGGTAIIALNAANEVAVAEFLAGRLRFDQIAEVVQTVVDATKAQPADSLAAITAADAAARTQARAVIGCDGTDFSSTGFPPPLKPGTGSAQE